MALSQEEAQLAVELFGSQAAAARALAVPRHTFRYWLNPELQKKRLRERYRADPEPHRERSRKHWREMSGVQYSRRLLTRRRWAALRRMAERNQRREAI